MRMKNGFLLLLWAASNIIRSALAATMGVTQSTTILKRGADALITSSFDVSDFGEDYLALFDEPCSYDGTISFSHPMSLKPGDQYFSLGQLQLNAMELMVEEINISPRCGVMVDGKRYGISMTTYGDDSSKQKVQAIVENGMLPAAAAATSAGDINTTFWLAPYSSGLTGIMSPYANDTNTVLIAGGSASTTVFKGNPTIFGTPPPTKKYLAQGIESLAKAGAKTYASVWEDAGFTRGVCSALPDLAEQFGLIVQSQTEVPASPTAEHFDPVARNLSLPENDPDVVVTCVYDKGCAEWVGSLRRVNWSPRAQVFTVCIGMESFVDAVGSVDAKWMTGIATWDPNLAMRDAVVGWNASEFADFFLANTARQAAYQSASAAGAVTALVQAIERANVFDSTAVASILATQEFDTVFGALSFDENGQSKAPSLHLQYNENTEVNIVYPDAASTGKLFYPMPTWEHRDCTFKSTCETGSASTVIGQCQEDGMCNCMNENALSTGIGPTASCVYVPVEDMTFISMGLLGTGLGLFFIQAIFSMSCAAWTMYYRKHPVVKASQPMFLCMIAFGTLALSLGIIPTGIQDSDPSINVNAACMALPWLFSMGFSIVFSALFAKIWRIKLVFGAAQRMRPKKVEVKDVAFIMIGVIMIQVVILLCWQLIDPMMWEREVLLSDANGYPLQSYGHCVSDNAGRFQIPLLSFDGLMLLYSLYLCFITRNVPSDFQEGTWIAAAVLSIIQILILAIPILIVVGSNNNAYYFVRATVLFLVSCTVNSLIFFPKIFRVHFKKEAPRVTRFGTATSIALHHQGRNHSALSSVELEQQKDDSGVQDPDGDSEGEDEKGGEWQGS
ncbi:hypothetical protein ACHAXR_013073 [Thalassiosira sp. AJA248-18]